ncbi:MAG: hypothetical protein LBS45_02405 [Synergistaceae bacterium]|jgi:hypothetical protein|nr:hypothetical protein [Synergistaceae bacterium]
MIKEKAGTQKVTPEVKPKQKLVGLTVRVDVETNRLLSAILSLKGMTLSGFLQDSIKSFIEENYYEAKALYDDIGRTTGFHKQD